MRNFNQISLLTITAIFFVIGGFLIGPSLVAQSLEVTEIEALDISSQGATVRWVTNLDIAGRVPHSVNQNNLPLPGPTGEKYREENGKYYYQVRISEVPLDQKKHFYKIFVDEDGLFGQAILFGSALRNINMEPSGSPINSDLIVDELKVVRDENETLKIVATVKNIGVRSSDPAKAKLLLIYGTNTSDIDTCLLGFCKNVANAFEASQLIPVSSLAVDETAEISFVNNLSFTDGFEYLIKAVVDNEKLIAEANEGNNTGTLSFKLGEEVLEETEKAEVVEEEDPSTSSGQDEEAINEAEINEVAEPPTSNTDFVTRERDFVTSPDNALTDRLTGKILLQVEERGEAWYVEPQSKEKYYLADGDSAYNALRAFGLGITNRDIGQIPIGLEKRADIRDADSDGLDDRLEDAIGTDKNKPDSDGDGNGDGVEVEGGFDPLGAGSLAFNNALANRLEGRILLQVEAHGEAWYIHEGKRYYLGDGDLAYQIMRFLSLGITNADLRKISVGVFE